MRNGFLAPPPPVDPESVLPRRLWWSRAAAAVWVAVFAYALVKNLASPVRHTVYPLHAKAARELARGEPLAVIVASQHLPYFAGVIVAPFAALPDRYGGTLWGLTSLAILYTGLRAFAGRFAPGDVTARAIILVAAPLAGIGSVANNQSNLFIAGCFAWGAALVHDRRWWTAAVVLAAPGFKLYTLAPGLVYAALYPRRFAARFAGAAAGWWLLPFLIYPADPLHERFATVGVYIGTGSHYENYPFMGVREFLERYAVRLGPGAYFPVQAAAGALIPVLLILRRRAGAGARDVDAAAAVLSGLWCVTFGPSVEPQTYLLAGAGLGLIVATGTRAAAGLAVAAVLICGPLQTDLLGPAVRTAVTKSKVACAAVTLVFAQQLAATAVACRRARHPGPDPGGTPGAGVLDSSEAAAGDGRRPAYSR